MGEDAAFFRWVEYMVKAGVWPFYDGCKACYWNCWRDWVRMNGESEEAPT